MEKQEKMKNKSNAMGKKHPNVNKANVAGKKTGKFNKRKSTNQKEVSGPPVTADDFSANWKVFLSKQANKQSNKQSNKTHITAGEQIKKKQTEKTVNTENDQHSSKSGKENRKGKCDNNRDVVKTKTKINNVRQLMNGKRENEIQQVNCTELQKNKKETDGENSIKLHKKRRKNDEIEERYVNKKKLKENETEDEVQEHEIWFDLDEDLLQKELLKNNRSVKIFNTNVDNTDNTSTNDTNVEQLIPAAADCLQCVATRYVAMDCEMVGVGIDGKESILARVSIVNSLGESIYDKFVKAKEKVVDYRTHVSGVRASDLAHAFGYEAVQKEVSDLLTGRVLVGHALQNDLKCLMLSHPKKDIRDTAKYKPFQKLLKTKRPALKRLAEEILKKEIQTGEHNSVVDARTTMQLFRRYKKEWEKSLHVKGEGTSITPTKEIYMGNEKVKKKKVNKWKKIRAKKKQKEKDM